MSNIALATVVSDEFVAGTLVMIDSFQRNNPWFSGDVVVIHEGLSGDSLAALKLCFPLIIEREISPELAARMAAVRSAAGWTGNKHLQFGSLEAFALEGYERVIFCDSDVLFMASILPLWEPKQDLVCCGDGTYFRGNARRICDFAEVSAVTGIEPGEVIRNTFNSGMMVIGSRLITAKNFRNLINLVHPERWTHDQTGHTDQMLLNQYFAGQQTIASPVFNYMLSHREIIENATGISPERAKVLHFTGPRKPWLAFEELGAAGMDRQYFAAFSKWRGALNTLKKRVGANFCRFLM